MSDKELEFFFELPEAFRPFGISPGSTTKKEVYRMIEEEKATLLAPEATARTCDNLLDENQSELVLGGLETIFGFRLKGLLVRFCLETVSKVLCIFDPGDNPEGLFKTIAAKLEREVFGASSGIQTSDDEEDISVKWPFRFFNVTLLLHRTSDNLLLLFADTTIERSLEEEEKKVFRKYFDAQMENGR